MPTTDASHTFQVSLAMAGAISAGSYSAGVLDFFFQALREWQKAKDEDKGAGRVPSHDVVITAISGASAGAITGALAPAALRFAVPGLQSGRPDGRSDAQAEFAQYSLKCMYEAWVVNIDMLPTGNNDGLLSTSDLKEKVVSLLNSDILEKIGGVAFGDASGGPDLAAIPYLSEVLHLYLMVTNLRGVPYEVGFHDAGINIGYAMMNHGDRMHFVVHGLGASGIVSQWAANDDGQTLAIGDLPRQTGDGSTWTSTAWRTCLDAALASSAFPAGLAPRRLVVDPQTFKARGWPFPHDQEPPLRPSFPTGYVGDPVPPPNVYAFTCVDGGVINNEPFEYAHYALLEPGKLQNPHQSTDADRAVVMIDPFPDPPDFKPHGDDQDQDIVSVLIRMFFIMKDQSRFKPQELAAAADENWYSRFLIGPRRQVPDGGPEDWVPTEDAIASGLLGGFGGFLHRPFRDHDYQLGRMNCQSFLREYFVLDRSNPVFDGWANSPAMQDARFAPEKDPERGHLRCIIPLLGDCRQDVKPLKWPQMTEAHLAPIIVGIGLRAKAMFPLLRKSIPNKLARLAAAASWFMGLKSDLLKYVEWTIRADLLRRGQFNPINFDTRLERLVVGELADPKYDLYTLGYLVDLTGASASDVTAILSEQVKEDRVYFDDKYKAWGLSQRKKDILPGLKDWLLSGPPTVAVPQARVSAGVA